MANDNSLSLIKCRIPLPGFLSTCQIVLSASCNSTKTAVAPAPNVTSAAAVAHNPAFGLLAADTSAWIA